MAPEPRRRPDRSFTSKACTARQVWILPTLFCPSSCCSNEFESCGETIVLPSSAVGGARSDGCVWELVQQAHAQQVVQLKDRLPVRSWTRVG
jgi:hypothetical protein